MKEEFSKSLLESIIKHFELNLSGLTVYTEAASGSYLLSPVLAALAGAKKVYAQTRDSRYGAAKQIAEDTKRIAQQFDLADKIEILEKRCHDSLAQSDIVTNSGFVRPIDRDLIAVLKPTAVIPLMWETWEFRTSDFDLGFCKERGILVLGTNEQRSPCDMSQFIGLCCLKLLFELGFDGGKVLLMGNAPIPAGPMVDYMRRIGIEVTWVSAESACDIKYEDLPVYFQNHGSEYDIVVLAEHRMHEMLIGKNGIIEFETVRSINPNLKIGVICGNIDAVGLKESGLRYFPEHIAPVGFMSYQPYMLGSRPVLTLYAAGLKVGEVCARFRMKGMSTKETTLRALDLSPAMDFEGDLSWG